MRYNFFYPMKPAVVLVGMVLVSVAIILGVLVAGLKSESPPAVPPHPHHHAALPENQPTPTSHRTAAYIENLNSSQHVLTLDRRLAHATTAGKRLEVLVREECRTQARVGKGVIYLNPLGEQLGHWRELLLAKYTTILGGGTGLSDSRAVGSVARDRASMVLYQQTTSTCP